MSLIYRLNFNDGTMTEDESLQVINDLRAVKAGVVELLEKKAQVKMNGAVLQTVETPDEATSVCEQLAQAAAEEARNQFTVEVVKTLVEPQPVGLN